MNENLPSILPTESEWKQLKEISTMAVKSGLLPASIRTPEAAAIIALKGRELGLPPMVAFSHINVIQGKPSMSAEIMLAYIYKDYPTAQIEIVERTEQKCVIKAKRPGGEKFATFTWDMERAKKMGLDQKDNWKKQPGTMLFWRTITEMKRAIFPEVLQGIDYSPEELGAMVNEQGEVKDVTPKTGNGPLPFEAKSIKNHAPQTREEAENWKPSEAQSSAPEQKEEESGPSRDEIIQEVMGCARQLGLTNKKVLEERVFSITKKASKDLSTSELCDLLLVFQAELADKVS